MERFKGTQAANAIRDEDHAGEGTVIQNKFSRSEIKLLHCIFKAFFSITNLAINRASICLRNHTIMESFDHQ